jgi:hypothetical protein
MIPIPVIPNVVSILLTVICLVLVGHSWYIHYIVKDGLARKMLLWGNGFLFAFLLLRAVNLTLFGFEVIDVIDSRSISFYNIFLIYALVIGQTFIQRGGHQRDESDEHEVDRKELKARRKKDK